MIDDSASVHVQAGTGAAETARQLRQAREELQRLCDEGGVADLASAQTANKRRQDAERECDSARSLDGVTLDVNQLSTGAREQMGIIARLACASIVSRSGGGAPVVLDDALGWSDPSRLQRMGAAIAAAGKECQVIILTCTPGRYAHVGNAVVVKLPG